MNKWTTNQTDPIILTMQIRIYKVVITIKGDDHKCKRKWKNKTECCLFTKPLSTVITISSVKFTSEESSCTLYIDSLLIQLLPNAFLSPVSVSVPSNMYL